VHLTTKGAVDGKTKKYVQSAEVFELMLKFAEEKLQTTGKEILQGNIAVNPAKTSKSDACKYCIYSELCGFKDDKAVTIETLDDNEILDRMKGSLSK
jgi:ATP-dependent helicase/nuclease subunit B